MANRMWTKVDHFMRTVHLYTGIFLVPWMLVYASSALCLNHGQWCRELFGIQPPKWEVVRQESFRPTDSFPHEPERQAAALVKHVGLDGPHRIQGKPNPRQLVVFRPSGSGHYRITWRKAHGQLLVEQQRPFSAYRLMHYLHFRHGYPAGNYWAEWIWGATVDAVGLSMWFWVVSGVYIWARRPKKRVLGGVLLVAGLSLFALLTACLCR